MSRTRARLEKLEREFELSSARPKRYVAFVQDVDDASLFSYITSSGEEVLVDERAALALLKYGEEAIFVRYSSSPV